MTLIQELNRIKNRIGLVSGSLRVHEYDDTEQNVSAHINPKSWDIEINVRRDFNPVRDRRQRNYARKKKIEDGKRRLLEDILTHELAHWELPFSSGCGCPFDPYNHDLIMEAVKKALPGDKQTQAEYVTNAFEDIIINPRCKEFKGDFSGLVLFWDDQGFQCKEKGQKFYMPFYEAFVKLNMHLFGDNLDKKLLKKYYSNDKKVDEAVRKTVEELNLPEGIDNTSVLFQREQWPRMASVFARNLANLLEVKPTEQLSAYSDNGDGHGQEKKQQAGNGVEEKAGTKEGKEEIAYGRYKNDKGRSPNIQKYEQLDSLYKRLARAIPVQVEAITKEHKLDIAPLNFRPFDEERDDIRKIKLSRLYFTEEGVIPGYKKTPLTVISRSKTQRRDFPDFKMVVLDNSGSMAEGIDGNQGNTSFIPWGDNSKYHYALLGFYGIEQFLQAQGVAQYIRHGLSLFSSSTRYKESDFRDIQRLRKLALSPDFGNDTIIEADTLLNALEGKGNFVLSISDGEVRNWSETKKDFYKLAENNYFAHIQIGASNQFARDLKLKGFPVFYVNSGGELSRLMINIAIDTYRRFTKT